MVEHNSQMQKNGTRHAGTAKGKGKMGSSRYINKNINNRNYNSAPITDINFKLLRKTNSSFGGVVINKQISREIDYSLDQDGRKQNKGR